VSPDCGYAQTMFSRIFFTARRPAAIEQRAPRAWLGVARRCQSSVAREAFSVASLRRSGGWRLLGASHASAKRHVVGLNGQAVHQQLAGSALLRVEYAMPGTGDSGGFCVGRDRRDAAPVVEPSVDQL